VQCLAVDVTSESTKMSKICEAATVKTKNLGNYKKSLETHNVEHKVYFLQCIFMTNFILHLNEFSLFSQATAQGEVSPGNCNVRSTPCCKSHSRKN